MTDEEPEHGMNDVDDDGSTGSVGGGEGRRVAGLVGELLGVLAEKVRSAGPDAVRVLTEEELQRHQLSWFRAGWEEHARASGQEDLVGPDRPPARLLPFPERPRGHEHPSDDGG
ncbi:hypothetical protein QFZ75_004159 [Streptomyces sp. V3I8]|nr:hypothetical protein [Streptomyces sp. V3I8]